MKYTVNVITSSKLGAGTDSDVRFILCGEFGESNPFEITKRIKGNALERGDNETFDIELDDLGRIYQIKIDKDYADDWKCESVKVTRERTKADAADAWLIKPSNFKINKVFTGKMGRQTFTVDNWGQPEIRTESLTVLHRQFPYVLSAGQETTFSQTETLSSREMYSNVDTRTVTSSTSFKIGAAVTVTAAIKDATGLASLSGSTTVAADFAKSKVTEVSKVSSSSKESSEHLERSVNITMKNPSNETKYFIGRWNKCIVRVIGMLGSTVVSYETVTKLEWGGFTPVETEEHRALYKKLGGI